MFKTYMRLLGFARPIKKYAIPYFFYSLFYALFNSLTFMLIIPILNTMFDANYSFEYVEKLPPLELNQDYLATLFNFAYSHIFEQYDRQNVLMLLAIVAICISLMSNLFRYLGAWTMENMRTRTLQRMRNEMFSRVMDMNVGYFSDQRKGDIISKITSDVGVVQFCITNTLQVSFREPFLIIGYIVMMVAISWELAIFSVLFLPVVALLIGSIVLMINKERRHEKEIEMLRIENLSSQYNAIANQISPHFFFNALSNLSSLVRGDKKQESLEYIGNLSGIFRYIIRFKESSLTTLGEELNFINSYKQLMDVRFAKSYTCEVDIPQQALNMRMPSLSLLPLFENIVKHNIIDSEHHMRITISFNDNNELVIANPVYPKLTPPESNGIGLTNLSNRYRLLLGKEIRIEKAEGGGDGVFRVFLPMVKMNIKHTR